ncbi:MAG: glutamine-hydrolyzing GMP synthase [archaeon]
MDKLAILDMGGQYCHLLARRIRDLGVYAEILPATTPATQLKQYAGIILSGGPASVYEHNAPNVDPALFFLSPPILGLCYGHQLMAHSLHGNVQRGKTKEYGTARLTVKKSKLFAGLAAQETVWMSHGDTITELPPGFRVIGSTPDCPIAAMEHNNHYGLQFHPEVTHTPAGKKMLNNFLDICNARRDWNPEHYLDDIISAIKTRASAETTGTMKKILLFLSGGVDSMVCLALLQKAIPGHYTAVHVDTGFMRLGESKDVQDMVAQMGAHVNIVNAHDIFFEATRDVYDPELKRQRIGDAFLTVFDQTLSDPAKQDWLLCQGTIYPDTIETGGTQRAAKIKTHHNRVGRIHALIVQGKLIEPLANLYKDEVRLLGKKLGMPDNILQRHPFPGPGLAVRCLCSDEDYTTRVHDVLPLRSVGVQGDDRTYKKPYLLRTLDWTQANEQSTMITNSRTDVNRVVALLYPDDIRDVHVKRASITKTRITLLQQADALVREKLDTAGLYTQVWQFPVILAPLSLQGGETIILRPVLSTEAMTASVAQLPASFLTGLVSGLASIQGIDCVLYDITSKPPGTIEWE